MIDEWQGCYDQGWGENIMPGAFSHPAKFSRGLIRRIYDHVKEMGWIKPGDWVLDPFGGVALGAVDAIGEGLNWVGVELEEKFIKLGRQNIELWNRWLKGWPNLGTARIIQGDSRDLRGVIERADLVVGSPPYCEGEKGHPSLGSVNKDNWGKDGRDIAARRGVDGIYSHTPGNLANLKEGKFDMLCGSPPYEETPGHGGKPTKIDLRKGTGGDIQKYGDSQGQLANSDTFWSASRTILEQCFDLLKPGGHAIFVVKSYVKNKKIVDFPGRWLALCESAGFKLICRHRAMLIRVDGYQKTISGNEEELSIERKSFFRRLAESKGSPRIDWEDVICLSK